LEEVLAGHGALMVVHNSAHFCKIELSWLMEKALGLHQQQLHADCNQILVQVVL
jgi:hypothetical protein